MTEKEMWKMIQYEREESEKHHWEYAKRQRRWLKQLVDLKIPIFEVETDKEERATSTLNIFQGRLWCFDKPTQKYYEITIEPSHNYYWVVQGDVPLDIALKLYAEPIGKTDVRINGHCGCPPPEAPWVEWKIPHGKRVLNIRNMSEYERAAGSDSDLMRDIGKKGLEDHVFTDFPEKMGAHGYIEHYHIDSFEGLSFFVSTLRREGLALPA